MNILLFSIMGFALAGWMMGNGLREFGVYKRIGEWLRSFSPPPPVPYVPHESNAGQAMAALVAAVRASQLSIASLLAPPWTSADQAYETALWRGSPEAFWFHPQRWDGVGYDDTGRLEPFWCHLPPDPPPPFVPVTTAPVDEWLSLPCGCPRTPPGISFEHYPTEQRYGLCTCLACGGQWVACREDPYSAVENVGRPPPGLLIGVVSSAGSGQVALADLSLSHLRKLLREEGIYP